MQWHNLWKWAMRKYFGQSVQTLSSCSLTEPLKHLPEHRPSSYLKESPFQTEINGLQVASEYFHGHVASLSVLLDAGSRDYTPNHVSGIVHVMDRLAFKVSIH
jgi:hypothetical protein